MSLFGTQQRETPEMALHRQSLALNKRQGEMEAGMVDDQTYLQQSEEREAILKWQQDLTNDLEELKHDLRNEVLNSSNQWVAQVEKIYDESKNKWVDVPMQPRMNDRGIGFVLTLIKRYISRNTMRCSLDTPTINKKMKNFGNDLAIALAVNYDYFGMNLTEYHALNSTIRNLVHFTLLRALNDGERRNEREIRRYIEAFSDKPQDNKKGLSLFGG